MMIGIITLGSFFAGLFGVAFLEVQAHKVDSTDEVPLELGLSIVGSLPILPVRHQQQGDAAEIETPRDRYWRNVLLESVDATRTLLVHAARTGSYQVIMITSATSGEGKTSLASYLATSMARSGLRTLLVDADLRRPMLHRLFDRPQGPGLSELLRGEADLDEALGATAVEGLRLLPAGRCDRQALRILTQGAGGPLFGRLKQQFDFIIVDSSPILPVADAMLIAQQADAAIFSIFREVSRKDKVRAASERLEHLGVPVLGAVVTGAHGGRLYGNDTTARPRPMSGFRIRWAVPPTVRVDHHGHIPRRRRRGLDRRGRPPEWRLDQPMEPFPRAGRAGRALRVGPDDHRGLDRDLLRAGPSASGRWRVPKPA